MPCHKNVAKAIRRAQSNVEEASVISTLRRGTLVGVIGGGPIVQADARARVSVVGEAVSMRGWPCRGRARRGITPPPLLLGA